MADGRKRVFQTKLTEVKSSDVEGVGTRRKEGNEEYIFCKGVASTIAGSVVKIDYNYTTALLTKSLANLSQSMIGVAKAAIVASKYGWYQVRGIGSVAVVAGVSDDKPLYTCGTAGKLGDLATISSVAQVKVLRLTANEAGSASSADIISCRMMYPFAA